MEVNNDQQQQKSNINEQVVLIMDQATTSKIKKSPPPSPRVIDSNASITQIPPTQIKALHRLAFGKPKSRLAETNYPSPLKTSVQLCEEEKPTSSDEEDSNDERDEYEEEEEYDYKIGARQRRRRKINKKVIIEFSVFIIIMICLICSLTLESLKHKLQFSIEIWKWCLMVMVIFCGRLVSTWVVGFIVFLIERNFMLRERVLYFVHGLRKSFQKCAWLGLVLLAWSVMFHDVHKHNRVIKKFFKALIAISIGVTIWLLKIVLVKVLASSFHVATFFDRMKESAFHHYILDTLSGPPLDEKEREAAMLQRRLRQPKSMPARLPGQQAGMRNMVRMGSRRIDTEKLRKLSMKSRPNAWSVKRLISYIKFSRLTTISSLVDDFGNGESEIDSEREARNSAKRIFKKIAKSNTKYIEEEDLLKFLEIEEVDCVFSLFEGAIETRKITKSSFKNWLVSAYVERKTLALSLNDTKTAVHQLHKLASAIVAVLIIVISLLVMGLATTKVIFLVTSQLLLLGFMFQGTCKTVFESIIFVFIMHPFDVGDRCVIDGVQMIVEEMDILTTVFLRYDKEKIYYPNSVLLTKPISNFRRSPDMDDSIDFAIDVSTSIDDFNNLKKAIQTYIESKPKYWSPKHSVIAKEIENVNKMNLTLCVQHTINHQNFGEKSSRRSELVVELKKIFDTLGIKYNLLPQEIRVSQMNVTNGRI